MEIDSKPEVMDKLDRRMIQLKIEREAVKREKDEASRKRPGSLIEEEIAKLQREYDDGTRSGRPRRPACRPGRGARSRSSAPRLRSRTKRKGDFDKVAELQYGRLPELEKRLEAQAGRSSQGSPGACCCAPRSAPRRSPRSSAAATGIPVSR